MEKETREFRLAQDIVVLMSIENKLRTKDIRDAISRIIEQANDEIERIFKQEKKGE